MPIALTDEMRDLLSTALADGAPCVLATATPAGVPDIGLKGSVFVYDADHLAYWERAHGQHLANVQTNPPVAVLYQNIAKRVGWRFFGTATVVTDAAEREAIMGRVIEAELNRDPERKGYAILIRVDKVVRGPSVIMERDTI